MSGRKRWLKTCGESKCSHDLHVVSMTTKNENGISKADLRSKKLVATQLSKDPNIFKIKGLKAMATLGEEGLIARGNKISKALRKTEDRTGIKRFRRSVSHYTKKQDLSDLPNYEKLKDGHEIDHILSVIDGFNAGLSSKQVSHKANLQVLSRKANRDKYIRSDMTVNELLEKIT